MIAGSDAPVGKEPYASSSSSGIWPVATVWTPCRACVCMRQILGMVSLNLIAVRSLRIVSRECNQLLPPPLRTLHSKVSNFFTHLDINIRLVKSIARGLTSGTDEHLPRCCCLRGVKALCRRYGIAPSLEQLWTPSELVSSSKLIALRDVLDGA